VSDKKLDEATGVSTTSHVWDDDVRELDNPLPRWWLYTFYACIAWACVFWIFYPAWPTFTSYTKGTLGYSQRATVAGELTTARASQGTYRKQIETLPVAEVRNDPGLLRFAMASGAAAFQTNCAPCHGRGAQGGPGYPNLNDDDWLWGGTPADIEKTLLYGIRSGHPDTRVSQMPRFGLDKILKPDEIDSATDYVLTLSKQPSDPVRAKKGEAIFTEQCAACHGAEGRGNPELGAPNLTDGIWLYGGSPAAIHQSIETGRGGAMPAWGDRLDKTTIKSLAIYVHGLGGGR
jgi:cytochrome c oxidase cbb3-type subunit III